MNTTSPPARKHRRPAQSCEPCRRRKVRCNLETPCSACLTARAPLDCTYRDGDFHNPPAAKRVRLSSHGDDIETAVSGPGLGENVTIERMADRLHHLEQKVAEMSTPTSGVSMSQSDCKITAGQPRLRHTTEKVKLFPPSHWLHTADKFKLSAFGEKDVELSFVDNKKELSDLVNDVRNLRRLVKSQQVPQLLDPNASLSSTFPLRTVCDSLVNHYLRTFELIYPVLHVPMFWKEYEQFWQLGDLADKSFAIKLALILSIGAIFSPDYYDSQIRQSIRNWIQAAQYWLVGPSEKATRNLNGIQVFCLLLVARQVTSAGASPWLSEETLLKVALSMGLHKDPGSFRLSALQRAMRTRLWTTVLELTVHGSMESSTPLLLSHLDFDDHAPQNFNVADLELDCTRLPPAQPLTSFTDSSIQVLLRKWLSTRIEATKFIQNVGSEQSYEKAAELAVEIQKMCRELATSCRLHWADHLSMHHNFLDMQLRRYILLLHRPFMLQLSKNPQFYLSQKMCVESAMIIASYAERITLPSESFDDLSRLIITSTGSFRGPFSMEIITILGFHVIGQFEESGGSSSSSSALGLDPLAELAKKQREPVVRILEHIEAQLSQIIRMGYPTIKRYVFLAGIIAQIRAMEQGENVQRALIKVAQERLKECQGVLQSLISTDMTADALRGFDDVEPFTLPDLGSDFDLAFFLNNV